MINAYLPFALTLIIEYIVLAVFLRKYFIKLAGFVLLVNLCTWPIANIIYDFLPYLLFIELGVIVVESFLIMFLFELSYRKSILISFIANLLSFLMGFVI